jgi:hypothetical protein
VGKESSKLNSNILIKIEFREKCRHER